MIRLIIKFFLLSYALITVSIWKFVNSTTKFFYYNNVASWAFIKTSDQFQLEAFPDMQSYEDNTFISVRNNTEKSIQNMTNLNTIQISLIAQCAQTEIRKNDMKKFDVITKPAWAASYPGSGSEMFRALVEAATGRTTDEVYNRKSNCRTNNPIICKTHYPLRIGGHSNNDWGGSPNSRKEEFLNRAIVLIRNPAKSIPSNYNYKWEEQHHIEGHSKQGTEQEWLEWRDRRFFQTMKGWNRVIESWLNSEYYEVAMFVPYEDLINEESGPKLLKQVVDVFNKTTLDNEDEENLSCIWYDVVKNKPSKKRNNRTYEPKFTLEQRNFMIQSIDQLLSQVDSSTKNSNNRNNTNMAILKSTLQKYRYDIEQHLPLDG